MLKNSLLSFLLAAALAVSTKAASLYPDGVLLGSGVTLTSLQADGWSLEFQQDFYSGPITQLDIGNWISAAGPGGYVFVGGLDFGGNVILGATGLASEVLSQTSSTELGELYSSSNLYWYNNPQPTDSTVGSMGFSRDPNIDLNEADVTFGDDPYRLSWHTNFNGGGFRIGEGGATTKVVLTWAGAPSSVPDAGSSLALLGAGLLMVVALRRRLA